MQFTGNLTRAVSRLFHRESLDAATEANLTRMVAEIGDRIMTRSMDIGETPAWTDTWQPGPSNVNVDLERNLSMAVRRSRGLVLNTDWGRRVMLLFRINVLGPAGMALQVRIKSSDGSPRKRLNDMTEKFWRAFCKRGVCEVTGKMSWRMVEKVLLDHLVRDGEWLFRYVQGGPLGFQVQVLNPALLDPNFRGEYDGHRIRMSIEIDAANRPVAYWLRADSDNADYVAIGMGENRRVRIPAAEINHFFVPEDSDQLRGMPWLISGARRLWLLKMFEESAAVASTNAARRGGFFISPDGDAPPGFVDQIVSAALEQAKKDGKQLSPGKIKYLQDRASQYASTMPGQFDTLPQGYDFKPFESSFPHVAYAEYTKEQVRGFTAGLGMSHATGGNNLESVNYSSAQVGIRDEREMYKTVQEDIIEALHADVWPRALAAGLLTSADLASFPPTYYTDAVEAAQWIRHRWADIDPLKGANANDINLKNRLTSPQRLIAGAGEDPEEIMAEILAWEEAMGSVGGNASADQSAAANADEEGKQTDQNQQAASGGSRHQPARLVRVRGA